MSELSDELVDDDDKVELDMLELVELSLELDTLWLLLELLLVLVESDDALDWLLSEELDIDCDDEDDDCDEPDDSLE